MIVPIATFSRTGLGFAVVLACCFTLAGVGSGAVTTEQKKEVEEIRKDLGRVPALIAKKELDEADKLLESSEQKLKEDRQGRGGGRRASCRRIAQADRATPGRIFETLGRREGPGEESRLKRRRPDSGEELPGLPRRRCSGRVDL